LDDSIFFGLKKNIIFILEGFEERLDRDRWIDRGILRRERR
jgi:hypothetical protein